MENVFHMLIPLLKDCDHELSCNNRPLSLLVLVSKICEKIVLKQFNRYLISKRRLTPHQSGNKKFYLTVDSGFFSYNLYYLNLFLYSCSHTKV